MTRHARTMVFAILVGVASLASGDETRILPLPTTSLVTDPIRGLLYAIVRGDGHPLDRRIVKIDPTVPAVIGAVVTSPEGAFLGDYPRGLALDREATVLYTLTGPRTMVRIRLERGAVDQPVELGAFENRNVPTEIAVMPGNPEVVAVYSYDYVVAYDHGRPRPAEAFGASTIVWTDDPTALYTGSGIRLRLTPAGFSAAVRGHAYLTTDPRGIAHEGGRLFFANGRIASAATGRLVGTCPGGGIAVAPALARNRIYYVRLEFRDGIRAVLDTCDATTYVRLSTTDLPFEAYGAVTWGSDGIAYRTEKELVVHGSEFAPCATDVACNDGLRCTVDRCEAGTCVHAPRVCGGDGCAGGVCEPQFGCPVTASITCADDEDRCTTDQCGYDGCQHTTHAQGAIGLAACHVATVGAMATGRDTICHAACSFGLDAQARRIVRLAGKVHRGERAACRCRAIMQRVAVLASTLARKVRQAASPGSAVRAEAIAARAEAAQEAALLADVDCVEGNY